MRKFIIYLLAAALILMQLPAAAAGNTVSVLQSGTQVTLSGSLDTSLENETVSCVVTNGNGEIYYINYGTAVNGSFSFDMKFSGDTPTGELTATLSSEYMNTPFVYRFLYRGSDELQRLLDSLNATGSASEYGSILMEKYGGEMTNMEYLGLDLSKLESLHLPYDNIYEYIRSHGPYTPDNFSTMQKYYLRSLELEAINQADAEGVKEAMLGKGKELGAVEENSITENLISGHTAPGFGDLVYEKMTGFNIASEADLKRAYDVSAALTAIEHPKNGRFDAAYVVENCCEVLDIGQEAVRFGNLSGASQTAVLTALLGNSYTSAAFKEAFGKLISEQENKKELTSSGGSGGGGSRPGIQTKLPAGADKNNAFADIEDVPWAADAIERLKSKGVVNGKTDDVFEPFSSVTREEFVKMTVLAFEMSPRDGALPFEDIPEGSWCGKYVRTALDAGIINGISESCFGVGMPVTRQDIAVIMYRAVKERAALPQTGEADFKDFSEVSQYASEAVSALSAGGIITGREDKAFDPSGNATRAEAAVMICRAVDFINKSGGAGEGQNNKAAGEKEKLLNGLGFLDSKYRGRNLSRGEFLETAVRLFGYEAQRVRVFSDVDENSQFYEAAGTAAVNGLVPGSTEYLCPEDGIKWNEAIRILITGMGYAPVLGGGDEELRSLAARLGIMPDGDFMSYVTYDGLTDVIYNLLYADILKVSEYGADKTSYETGGRLLETVHKIYREKGFITETEISGLYGPTAVGEDEIMLKNADGEFRAEMKNSAEYLGHEAVMYFQYDENDERKVVYLQITDDDALVIQGEDIEAFDGSRILYSDGGRVKGIDVSEDTAIIYNGAAITEGEELSGEWYKPENGTVTFIEGKNGVGSIIIVNSYYCIAFSAYTEKDGMITLHDRYGGRAYTCDSEQITFYDKNGDEILPAALSEYDIISVCAPKKMNDRVRVRAYVSNDGITGTITALNPEEKEVVLEAETFTLSGNLTEYIKAGKAPAFRIGQKGKFYLDYFGKIAAFDTENASAAEYLVYLMNVYTDESGPEECAAMKVLTADNKIKIYKTGSRVQVNDRTVRYDSLAELFSVNGTPQQQLILLIPDEEDLIRSVYTAQDKGSPGRLFKTYTPKSPSETLSYRAMTYGLGGKIIVGISATKVFVVPNEKTLSEAGNEDYAATNRDYFADGASYRVQGYSVSDENVMDDAVVVYVDAGSENIKITDGSTLCLVDEVFESVNDEEDAGTAIRMMYNGNLQTFFAGDDVDVSEIHSGDAVQVKLNAANEIQKIRKVFDYETKTVVMGNTYGSFTDGLHVLYGPCININGTAIEQESLFSNGVVDTEKFLIQGNCYVYDSSLSNDRVRVGSYTEIQSQRLAGDDATMLLCRRNGGTVREYIIYK